MSGSKLITHGKLIGRTHEQELTQKNDLKGQAGLWCLYKFSAVISSSYPVWVLYA